VLSMNLSLKSSIPLKKAAKKKKKKEKKKREN
jgi:hypothetical protein